MNNLEAKQEAIKKAYGENYIHADKNGWIRHLMYCPSDLGIENYDDIACFVVEKTNGGFSILSDFLTEFKHCLIIGNIYENPKLI